MSGGFIHDDRLKKQVCKHCGSENVTQDATARWNTATQEWEISSLLDCYDCADCCTETRIKEELL